MAGYYETGKYYSKADTLFFLWTDSCTVYQQLEDSIAFSQNEDGLFLMDVHRVIKSNTFCSSSRSGPSILFANNGYLYRKRHANNPHYFTEDLAFIMSDQKAEVYHMMENEAMLNWLRWQMEY
jgi:hypothetical protein